MKAQSIRDMTLICWVKVALPSKRKEGHSMRLTPHAHAVGTCGQPDSSKLLVSCADGGGFVTVCRHYPTSGKTSYADGFDMVRF